MTAADIPARPALANRRVAPAGALASVGAALFACAWGGNQFTPLLTLYRRVDGWGATTVDGLLAAYVFGLAPALLLGGRLSDRHGRRRPLLLAVASSLAGSGLLAVGPLPVLAAGRLLSGVGVGLAMAVGTTWAAELAASAGSSRGAGARRASLSLTAGFGLGAGVAGCLAQWGPRPATTPYLVHLGVAAAAMVWLTVRTRGAAELPVRAPTAGLVPTSARDRHFLRVVVPAAPWVFGSAAVAYAILPQALAHRVHGAALLFATLLTVVTLGCGVAVQPQVRRLDRAGPPVALRSAMVLVVAGTLLAAAAVASTSPPIAVGAAAVLGLAYGIGLVAGLLEVQRLAPPGELASLTGLFGALTYVGFLFPALLAALGGLIPTAPALVALAVAAAGCGAGLWRRRPA